MIRFILIQNRLGKTRMARWYNEYDDAEKEKLQLEIHRLISSRDSRFTNFIEFMNYKIIYKRYMGLYITICIDYLDNELAHLELIQLLVELLNDYFGAVSELDLIYKFHLVYAIIDEMILGGEIAETSKKVILTNVRKNLALD
jgi:AP-2 complex subunit sigma-1